MKHWVDVNLKRFGLKVYPKQQVLYDMLGARQKTVTQATELQFKLFIDGVLCAAQGDKHFEAVDPSTGQVFARLADASPADMRRAIDAAARTHQQGAWSGMSMAERGIYLKRAAQLIRKYAKELAELECRDVGKTIKHATFIDVPTCADTFEYFGGLSDALETRKLAIDAPVNSWLMREPMGVVGCIIPWNYPLIMAGWKMAPALAAGNCVVFKPSSSASAAVMRLAEILEEVQFPPGVVNVVSGRDHEMAAALIRDPKVNMVSFTGGTETGRRVMREAAATNKKISLELGGKSPSIVFADCEFEAAVGGVMAGIFLNQGQMCTAGSRLLLEDDVYDKFLEALVKKTKALKIGPADRYDTDFGPLVSASHRDSVVAFVEAGKKEGAKLLCGGRIPQSPGLEDGFYFEPTIFAEVDNRMRIAREECFGPVLSVIRFSGADEAVRIANDSRYGLAAMVWTTDQQKAQAVARRLQCGTVWINTYGAFFNQAPFGGYKESGFGRELGEEGLFEYTQTKHVCQDKTPGGKPLVSNWF